MSARKKIKPDINKTIIEQNTIHFRRWGNEIRVWRTNWFSDQFEIVMLADFEVFFRQARALNFHFRIHVEDDEKDNGQDFPCLDWKTVLKN